MALGDLVKRIFVSVKVDGAEEAKLQLDDLAARADELGRMDPTIKPTINDDKFSWQLRALSLKMRALQLQGADKTAFAGIANDARDLGDAFSTARLKGMALGLEMRALKEMAQGGGDNNGSGGRGGFFRGLFSGLSGGLVPSAVAGSEEAGSGGLASSIGGGLAGIPVIGGLFGAAGAAGLPAIGAAIGAVAAAVGALLVEIQAVVSGFAAAAQGVGAFGLLAYPTIMKIFGALGNSDKSIDRMTPGMQNAIKGVQGLETAFGKLVLKFQPDVLKLFNIGLQAAGQILKDLPPFATAAFRALDPLLKAFNTWLGSKSAQQLQNTFLKLEGPSITAIGKGIGNVALALTHLVTALSAQDVAHAINIFFDTVAGAINGIAWLLKKLPEWWDAASRTIGPILKAMGRYAVQWWDQTRTAALDIWHVLRQVGSGIASVASGIGHEFMTIIHWNETWYNAVVRYGGDVLRWFQQLPSEVGKALSALGTDLFNIGKNAIQGLINGITSMGSSVLSAVGNIASSIPSSVMKLLGIRSPSKVMFDIGVNIGDGLIDGLNSRDKKADAAAKRITAIIMNRIKAAEAYAASVRSNAEQFAGIAGAATGPAFAGYHPGHYNAQGNWVAASGTKPPTAPHIFRNMSVDLARIRKFADAIRKLSNRGLDRDLIAQIVAAGPGAGLELADALLHSPGAIHRADRLENRINRQSARLAGYATGAQYGGGYYNITVNGALDAHAVALEIEKILKRLKRHRGGGHLGIA